MRSKILVLAIVAVLAAGCGTLKPVTAIPAGGNVSLLTRISAALLTRASMDDFIWEGSAGASVPIEQEAADAAGNPDLAAAIAIATATHLIEPSGARVLRITLAGETKPRIFFCQKDLAIACEPPLNAGVRVYAAPVSLGNLGILVVHRIVLKAGG